MPKTFMALFAILILSSPLLAQAQIPEVEEQTVSENELESAPSFIFDLSYILDSLSNVSGGAKKGTKVMGSMLLEFDLDGEKAFGWKGSRFFMGVLGLHGEPLSDLVGDFQTVSNIEAPSTVNLFELKYQQRLGTHFEFQLGMLALDSNFDTRSSAELFVHSSPGTGGDIGQLGLNGPGIFPVGALGARLQYENEGWFAQVAAIEGTPGDPNNPFGNTFQLTADEGLFVIGELGHIWQDEVGELGKVGLGGWGFTRGFETHANPNVLAGNRGAYLTLEKSLHRENDDPSQGLAGYLRTGVASGSVNPIETFVGAGLVYTGAFSGRDKDMLGIAVNSGFASKSYMDSGPFCSHETAVELTYSFHINDSLSIQPDLQYIVNPGFDPTKNDSLVLGLRAVSTFSTF